MGKVKKYITRINEFYYNIQRFQDYLMPGEYTIEDNIAYRRQYESLVKRNPNKNIKKIIKQLIKMLFLNYKVEVLKGNGCSSNFCGEKVLYTINGNLKIFDFENNKVLTYTKSKKELTNYIETYNYFNNKFNIPKLLEVYPTKNIYIEEYIEGDITYDKEQTIESIFRDYFSFFENNFKIEIKTIEEFNKEILNALRAEEDLYNYCTRLYDRIKNKRGEKIGLIECHGDICFKNIIVKKGKLFYIDWEYRGSHLFFYDLINWMFVEAYDNRDYRFLKYFFNGNYDCEFKRLFNILGYEYHSDFKYVYFILYILERINLVVKKKPVINQPKYLKKYSKIMEEVI